MADLISLITYLNVIDNKIRMARDIVLIVFVFKKPMCIDQSSKS